MPLMINVVVPDSVLLGDDDGFGWVEHYGPVPGDLLREWIAANAEQGVDQWVRRLYVAPETGELVAMDSKAASVRGQAGRVPAAARPALPHPVVRRPGPAPRPRQRTTPTAARPARRNGQGLCEDCNYAKQALGWSARPRPGPRHTVETVTPTGHRYLSTAPAMTVAERGLRVALDGFVLTA